MKNLAISAILAFAAHAITLSEVTESDKKMMIPGEEVEQYDRTIVGFLFNGFDFGELWENLQDDQREMVKSAVFQKTLEFNGFKADDYKEQTFRFTDEQRTAQDKKIAEQTALAESGAGAKKEEKKPEPIEEKKDEKKLVEVGHGRCDWNNNCHGNWNRCYGGCWQPRCWCGPRQYWW